MLSISLHFYEILSDKEVMRIYPIFIILFSICLIGCSSMPIRNTPQTKPNLALLVLGSVSISGCQSYEQEAELDCLARSEALAATLKDTKLFTKITIDTSETDWVIALSPNSQNPYYLGLGHNPGILLLSAVIPFWEDYEYGHHFTMIRRGETEVHQVNTIENGTHLMWSASMLINLLPSRGIPGTFVNNEVEYLRNTIINTVNVNKLEIVE